MRGTTHPENPKLAAFSFFSFSYSILIFGRVPALFHPLEFVTQGAPEPRDVRMRYNPGGASTESQFPDSPEWVTTKDHPPSTPALVCRQRNAAMPWKGLPPHRIVSLLVVKCGQRKRRYAMGRTAPPPHCSSRVLLGTEKTPLCRGRDCPPTALFSRLVFCGNDMFWTCR